MAFKSGFFNSVDGDRLYNADDLSQFYYGLISNGIIADPINSLAVSPATGMKVSVAAGRAMISCKYFVNTEAYELTLQAADETNPRIDRVILKYDALNREITIVVRTGTPAATPTAPALVRSGNIYELSLASIAVAAEASAVTAAMITDERTDPDVCGLCSFNAPESFAFDAGTDAIITDQQRDINAGGSERVCVTIRCHDIDDVTPASESWATGSIAWEIPSGKFYGLDTDGTWKEA